jgi:hypothetical protein
MAKITAILPCSFFKKLFIISKRALLMRGTGFF